MPRPTEDTAGRCRVVLSALMTAIGAAACAPAGSPAPPAISTAAPPALIDHVQWASGDRGRTLRVFPSPVGRHSTAPSDRTGAWSEVLRAAPAADTPSLRDQFFCHWDFARIVEPDKPSWNLETWRPEVSYAEMVQAECNPGGPE